jgi:hypothetical protein
MTWMKKKSNSANFYFSVTPNIAPVILAGKVDLIVFIGSLPHRLAATFRSIFTSCRDSLSI